MTFRLWPFEGTSGWGVRLRAYRSALEQGVREGARNRCPPWHGLGPHPATLPSLQGETYTRNLADGDSEAVWQEEFWRSHSHAALLCLPTVFLDLLCEGLGSAQATAGQTHRHRR